MPDSPKVADETISAAYRAHSRRVLATLIRLLGGFELAEEALQDAFLAAARQWPRQGIPKNPYAWLVSAGRFKAIDRLRQRARFDARLAEYESELSEVADPEVAMDAPTIADDELRLIFICCHPELGEDGQIALALREICGLTTEEIARAYLVPAPTIAQRIVRAKAGVRDKQLPFALPDPADFAGRLDSVLRVIYLIFNEGYSASSGENAIRVNLAAEAIRLGRLLGDLAPEPETWGLLALMLLQYSRRAARTDQQGRLVLFDDQDRSKWDRRMIDEGMRLLARIREGGEMGIYGLQAAIAAVHATGETSGGTDWPQIIKLYDLLLEAEPSPVVELNRAVAVSKSEGPASGLSIVDRILASGALQAYAPAHMARADCLRRLERRQEALAAYESALSLTRQDPEQAFIRTKIAELEGS